MVFLFMSLLSPTLSSLIFPWFCSYSISTYMQFFWQSPQLKLILSIFCSSKLSAWSLDLLFKILTQLCLVSKLFFMYFIVLCNFNFWITVDVITDIYMYWRKYLNFFFHLFSIGEVVIKSIQARRTVLLETLKNHTVFA